MAIKKVLQDKRYKNRELQIMRMLNHPNVVALRHYFYTTTEKDELYLNLVLEYVPQTIYQVSKHYYQSNNLMPLIYIKLYTYQVRNASFFVSRISMGTMLNQNGDVSFMLLQMCRGLAYIHNGLGICHRDIKPQNVLVSYKFSTSVVLLCCTHVHGR